MSQAVDQVLKQCRWGATEILALQSSKRITMAPFVNHFRNTNEKYVQQADSTVGSVLLWCPHRCLWVRTQEPVTPEAAQKVGILREVGLNFSQCPESCIHQLGCSRA